MRYGVFMGYMWDIRGVFTGYSYVSGMCRVCIGYVSGMRRNILDASGVLIQISCKKNKLPTTKTTKNQQHSARQHRERNEI